MKFRIIDFQYKVIEGDREGVSVCVCVCVCVIESMHADDVMYVCDVTCTAGSHGNRLVTHEQLSIARAKQLQEDSDNDPSSKKHLESELSLELMDTQDKLRRTTARLEILEIIQMEMSENAAKIMEDKTAKEKKTESVESQSDDDDDGDAEEEEKDATESKEEDEDEDGAAEQSRRRKDPPAAPLEESKEVSFDEIMSTVQEVRALVAQRGAESMVAGSLLCTPSALLPLQDVEDNKKHLRVTTSAKNSMANGFGEEKTQSHTKGILSKVSNIVDSNSKGRSNKKIQVAALIHLMNSSIVSISEEVTFFSPFPFFHVSFNCFVTNKSNILYIYVCCIIDR
jgi:hypothetical protein